MTYTAQEKQKIYDEVVPQILRVTENEPNITARMATVSCLLNLAFDTYFWTGFYVVDDTKGDELVVGPYQGTLGCLRIKFGKGVCGTAAAENTTQLVPNVHDFPGHIACDSRSNSEIVVPVHNADGSLLAVLDVDSEQLAAFDEVDQEYLEKLMKDVFAR